MSIGDRPTVEDVLAGFDEHLRRTRGVCPGTRRYYARFVRAFLQAVFADGRVEAADICVRDVVDFVGAATRRYQAGTVELAASALRSFFRFLRAAGLRSDRMEDAVPMVPHRRAGLPRHLDPARFEQLIASLDSSSPRGLRDRAIILCMARLGLRASEVTRLRLEDIDWRGAVVRVPTGKTGHGALLPLPGVVGAAPGAPSSTGVVTFLPPHRPAANRCSVRSATTTPCRPSKIPIFTTGTPPSTHSAIGPQRAATSAHPPPRPAGRNRPPPNPAWPTPPTAGGTGPPTRATPAASAGDPRLV